MTERERNQDGAAERPELAEQRDESLALETPILSHRDEQKLLQEANNATPPSLNPADTHERAAPTYVQPTVAGGPASFGVEALDVVRRHPIPALLVSAGVAYLLVRRRR